MPRFVISYDLIAPGKNYDTLWAELNRLQARRILFSQWGANIINANAVQVRDHLRQFMDPNDRILVMDRDGPDWAAYNLLGRLDQL